MSAGLGAFVGIVELISRYREAPLRIFKTLPAWVYLLINAFASAFAFFWVTKLNLTFNVQQTDLQELVRVLVAGGAAMTLFRSSLFTFRFGDQDVPIGLNAILATLLTTVDRAVDRIQSKERAALVAEVMQDVDFDKAKVALPTYAMALMQNLSAEEQLQFSNEITALSDNSDIDDSIKLLVLGLTVMNLMGDKALREAVSSLGDKIK